MPEWTDRYSHLTPRKGFIIGRLPDGTEKEVEWNPLKQGWFDREGNEVSDWETWRELVAKEEG